MAPTVPHTLIIDRKQIGWSEWLALADVLNTDIPQMSHMTLVLSDGRSGSNFQSRNRKESLCYWKS